MAVSVIKKCGCVSPECHRVAFREVYKRKSEKGWIQEVCESRTVGHAQNSVLFFLFNRKVDQWPNPRVSSRKQNYVPPFYFAKNILTAH